MSADDDHRHVGVDLAEHTQQIEAVDATALQPDVEHHERRATTLDGLQRFIGVARSTHLMAFVLENAGHQFSNVGFIIDDQHVGRHGFLLSLRLEGVNWGQRRGVAE